MEPDNNTVYSIRVACKNKNGFYRIQTKWSCDDEKIHLILLDDLTAFESVISNSQLHRLAKKYERTDFELYTKLIKSSLTEADKKFLYNRHENCLYIYKQEDNITFQIIDFILEQVDFNKTVIYFIDELSATANHYRSQIFNYKNETLNVLKEKEESNEKVARFIEEKNHMEHDLYSKFLLILNEKKLRIQYLQEVLESSGQISNIPTTKTRETISESGSDTSHDESETFTHTVQIETTPTKKPIDFLDDDDDSIDKIDDFLPKRMKIAKNIQTVLLDMDEIQTEKSLENTVIQQQQSMKENELVEKNDSFEFSTQDLFDRL